MRIGQGFDVHAFAAGRKLVIGGVEIAHDKGLAGHSDADVLLHAICDALLGAAALGDIGRHYPNTDHRFKDISSLKLVSMVKDLLITSGYQVINIDSTVALEAPKIAEFIPAMRQNISESLSLPVSQVSVKATTNERLGPAGRGEGCAAFAVASLIPLNSK